jgi:hypothetical protein
MHISLIVNYLKYKMKTLLWITSFTLLFLPVNLSAQTHEGLIDLEGYSIKTYYSPGSGERAKEITERCIRTIEYVSGLTDFTPEVSLFVLSPEHWEKYGAFPLYGMPHTPDYYRLIVASEDNDFWRSFIPPVENLPSDLAEKVKQAYTNNNGELSMMAFFDLLALHELGHAFHGQAKVKTHRKWMGEFFSNLMLHTYIAENEPENLPALEVFPEMVVASGSSEYAYTSLKNFEELYDNMDGKNYGWYQSKLHFAARNIYNAGGEQVFINLWNALKSANEKMTDEEFADLLNNKVDANVAKIQTEW